jgi:hypothetical protein
MPEREEGNHYYDAFEGADKEIWGVSEKLLTHGFGQEAATPVETDSIPEVQIQGSEPAFYESAFWRALSLAGTGIGAYHGYKRNNSVGWAIGWGFLGALFPIIVIPVAFAQGIGKPKR